MPPQTPLAPPDVQASPIELAPVRLRTPSGSRIVAKEGRGVWGVCGSELDDPEGGGREQVCPKNQGPDPFRLRFGSGPNPLRNLQGQVTLQFGGSNDP